MRDVLAFSADQVRQLTGLSEHQLRYWDRTEFFSPTLAAGAARLPYSRAYSFRDVVGLRAIAEMRKVHRIPLQELRKVGAVLAERFDAPWSQLSFYIVGKAVFYQEDKATAIKRARPGQQEIMPFDLVRVVGDVRRGIERLRERTPEQLGHVIQQRYLAGHQPVIAGTRVPTRAIWEFHAAGYSDEAIAREYPQLTADDIQAAIGSEKQRLRPAS